jgi:hypothetical protein
VPRNLRVAVRREFAKYFTPLAKNGGSGIMNCPKMSRSVLPSPRIREAEQCVLVHWAKGLTPSALVLTTPVASVLVE